MPSFRKRVYIFGDDFHGLFTELSRLLRVKGDVILTSFFDQAYRSLRAQIGSLPQSIQCGFPHFTSIAELNRICNRTAPHPALRQSLLCIQQLGSFIYLCGHANGVFPEQLQSHVVGIGLGALPAAVVSASKDLLQLLPVALDATRLTFSLGLLAERVARSIEPSSDSWSEPWSISIIGIAPNELKLALANFCEQNEAPKTSAVYVSRISNQSIHVAGPPSRLVRFIERDELQNGSADKCIAAVPYHAPHLYSTGDAQALLFGISSDYWAEYSRRVPYICGSTTEQSWATSLNSLLEEALCHILLRQARLDKLADPISVLIRDAGLTAVDLFCFGARDVSTQFLPDIELFANIIHDSGIDDNSNIRSLSPLSQYKQSLPAETSQIPISQAKIAIIGISGRFPEADNTDAFWRLLSDGRDVHKPAPPTRWNIDSHVDTAGRRKNTSATPFGCWLDDAGLFDAKFFHLSPREAPQTDPAQRIALMTAYEAIEQAGLVPGATPSTKKDRVGVFYGVTSNDWMETNSAQNIDTYMIPGGNRAFIPGRINYFFKFSGPSYSIDTACSSSLAAVHAACNSLWRGDIDTAIVGGTNVLTNPDFTAGLDRGHFLSRTGGCKTFDDSADGYCRGEGVCTLILKREEDALVDKDPIQALILSTYTNHSADAESITRPHGGAQKAIFNKLLNDAGVEPNEVSYVECHGTGTQAGDAEEMRSVLETFAPNEPENTRSNDQKLYLGSAKANIGHGEAASGVSSLAKVLLMMKHDRIPPHCGIKKKINHKFPTDMKERKVYIADKLVPWHRSGGRRRKVMVNNFSAAGGNSALLMEDTDLRTPDNINIDSRASHCVAISAKCSKSLAGNIDSILSYLDGAPVDGFLLSRLSYTTTARRIHHAHRVMARGSSIQEIREQLLDAKRNETGFAKSISKPQVTFAFTGQGSQYARMGKEYYDNFSSFRSNLSRLDGLAQGHGFPSFIHLICDTDTNINDTPPLILQCAMVALEIALALLWMSWGIQPKSVVGHSLGEYAALNIAGVLSESDVMYLVGTRAQLMQKHCIPGTHSMLAVMSSLASVMEAISGTNCDIACVNGPSDVVVSGEKNSIKNLQTKLSTSQIKSTILKVPFAFHSSQVDPILRDLELAAAAVNFHSPTVPIICPTQAAVIDSIGIFGPAYLARHCRERVDIYGAIQSALQGGYLSDKAIVIEIGPQPTVSRMVRSSAGTSITTLPSLQQNESSWKLITNALSTLYSKGLDLNWREYHHDFTSSQVVLDLPAYSWDLKNYWIQYVNDWSLRKGDPIEGTATALPAQKPLLLPLVQKSTLSATTKKLESSTIHKVIQNTISAQKGTIIVESDLSRSDLNPLIKGHCVNGIPLATPSIYAEIALAIGDYALEGLPHRSDLLVNICDMTIEKALIARNKGSQLLRATFEFEGLAQGAKCRFETITDEKKKPARHSQCRIEFLDKQAELLKLSNTQPAILQRILALQEDIAAGKAYRFNRAMVYKMVGTIAQFDPNYMGLKEVVLNSEALEAYSAVSFEDTKIDGNFHTHPAFIDALSQVGGFIMNANDNSNLEEEVFINHGWGGFRIFEPLQRDKEYQVHARMCETPGRKWEGNLTILDAGRPIACFSRIVLQGVGKRALHFILQRESELGVPKHAVDNVTKRSPPAPKQTPALTSMVEQHSVQVIQAPQPVPAASAPGPSLIPEIFVNSSHAPTNIKSQAMLDAALQIISEESGIGLDELSSSSNFAEAGIDSLLSLIITGRFKEELDLDLDGTSFFTSVLTVRDLKEYLGIDSASIPTSTGPQHLQAAQTDLSSLASKQSPTASVPFSSPLTQPQSWTEVPSEMPSARCNPPVESLSLSPQPLKRNQISPPAFVDTLAIISEEMGIDIAEFSDDTNFVDIGLDSLLSLIVVGRMREELSIDLPAEVSLYTSFPTVKELRAYFGGTNSLGDEQASNASSDGESVFDGSPGSITRMATPSTQPTTPSLKPMSSFKTDSSKLAAVPRSRFECSQPSTSTAPSPRPARLPAIKVPPASSVVLQGRPRRDPHTLILFPDGGGSASSYASMPRIHPLVAVIGLNCPFARDPEAMMSCDMPGLVVSYINEVRRRQPQGPYILGGWSSGGILAYAAAQRLVQEGEEVERLVLIDSPLPLGLDRLPQRWFDLISTIDLFGTATAVPAKAGLTPAWLVPHFKATIEVLHDFYAEPMPYGFTPLTTIIWATECVLDGVRYPKLPPGPDDTEGMKFLTEKRTDFSTAGWERFLPGEEITVESIGGAHHFSMMGEYAPRLAEAIGRAMEKA